MQPGDLLHRLALIHQMFCAPTQKSFLSAIKGWCVVRIRQTVCDRTLSIDSFIQGVVATQFIQGVVATQFIRGVVATQFIKGVVATQFIQAVVATQFIQGVVATQFIKGVVATQFIQGFVAKETKQSQASYRRRDKSGILRLNFTYACLNS